jgi:hypothetical protein
MIFTQNIKKVGAHFSLIDSKNAITQTFIPQLPSDRFPEGKYSEPSVRPQNL